MTELVRLKSKIAAAFLWCLTCTNVLAEQFSFRGAEVGITLSEFRKVPFPDEKKYPGTRPLCSGDKEVEKLYSVERPQVTPDLARIGVVACNYFSPTKNPPRIFRNAPDMANIGGYETTYFFSPQSLPETARGRLYLITITPRSEHYSTIVDALTEKYGKPSESASTSIKTRMGMDVTDEVTGWRKESSTILAKKFNDTISQSLVTYSHDRIVEAVNDAVRNLRKENSKQL